MVTPGGFGDPDTQVNLAKASNMSPLKSGGSSTVAELSSQLASAVERAASSVVAIHARRRIPSSGVIWRDGLVVSAAHTIRRDGELPISLPSGESVTGTIVGQDPATDLAVIRVPAAKAQPSRADADTLRVGSLVLAVGRPGRNVTASFGIISAVGESWRSASGTRLDRVARLDLAVYDGFSGGPLVDGSGAILGINNSALARGTPMAIAASGVDRVVDALLDRGHVRRPFIGVAVQPVAFTPSAIKRLSLAHDSALLITSVAESSPAEKAGLLVGDLLLTVQGQPLRRPVDLLDQLAETAAGAQVALEVLRGGVAKSVSVTPDDRGAGE